MLGQCFLLSNLYIYNTCISQTSHISENSMQNIFLQNEQEDTGKKEYLLSMC